MKSVSWCQWSTVQIVCRKPRKPWSCLLPTFQFVKDTFMWIKHVCGRKCVCFYFSCVASCFHPNHFKALQDTTLLTSTENRQLRKDSLVLRSSFHVELHYRFFLCHLFHSNFQHQHEIAGSHASRGNSEMISPSSFYEVTVPVTAPVYQWTPGARDLTRQILFLWMFV